MEQQGKRKDLLYHKVNKQTTIRNCNQFTTTVTTLKLCMVYESILRGKQRNQGHKQTLDTGYSKRSALLITVPSKLAQVYSNDPNSSTVQLTLSSSVFSHPSLHFQGSSNFLDLLDLLLPVVSKGTFVYSWEGRNLTIESLSSLLLFRSAENKRKIRNCKGIFT